MQVSPVLWDEVDGEALQTLEQMAHLLLIVDGILEDTFLIRFNIKT